MKKTTIIKSLLFIGCLVVLTGAVQAKAEEPVIRAGYIDEDGDGICDNWNGQCKRDWYHYVDENEDGICDNRTLQCNGTGYQDGNCDHYGSGNSHMHRHGRN